jgi:hypothetical protein
MGHTALLGHCSRKKLVAQINQLVNAAWVSRTAYAQRLDPSQSCHMDLTRPKQKSRRHDTHAMAPVAVWDMYKKYQKMDDSAIDNDLDIVDFRRGLSDAQKAKLVPVATVPSETIAAAGRAFKLCDEKVRPESGGLIDVPKDCTIYEHKEFDGLYNP